MLIILWKCLVEYRIDKPLYPKSNKQEQILNSPYFKVAASFAQAALVGGLVEPEEIAEHAINLTDQLIQKVGEKI
ncbi:MAG: hypothetical protein QNJ55_12345 [Xenococcus sp. MO_188.B8]|nr:hypothetical protein [Xenococcus sp. MO_188.B8]